MSTVREFEHYFWLHEQIMAGKYPNAARLAEQFELSERTGQRHIEAFRDRFGAPMAYDHTHKGYYYTEASFTLPPIWLNATELLCWLIASNLLSSATSGFAGDALKVLEEKLFCDVTARGINIDAIRQSFSAQYGVTAPSEPRIFQPILTALLCHRCLEITYHAPQESEPAARTVEPHHLFYYSGTWALVGWCRLKSGWRQFHLSRIRQARALEEVFTKRPAAEWSKLVNGQYGLFQGENTILVRLRFSPFIAPWIRNQIWHRDQSITECPEGGIELALPVADLREIKMRVLQYGAEVSVIEPPELVAEIRAEVEKMHERLC